MTLSTRETTDPRPSVDHLPRPRFKVRFRSLGALALLATTSIVGCGGGSSEDGDDNASDGGGSSVDGTGATGSGGTGADKPDSVVVPGGIELGGSPKYYGFVRLTHQQWENSVRDVFGLNEVPGLSKNFHPDAPAGHFSNNELALEVGEELWEDYSRSAESLAKSISSNSSVTSALGGLDNRSTFIQRVAKRAFRRDLTADELAKYEALWDDGATFFASGNDDVDGARVFIDAVLQSPHFLYRIETADEPGGRLSGAALATKISLLLRNTLPNDDLLNAADAGELDTNEGLMEVTETMLAEDDARDAVALFHTELYGLDRYRNIQKSTSTFPDYAVELNQVLLEADLMFFNEIYETDGGVTDIFTSPVVYMNDQISGFYGIEPPAAPGPFGPQPTGGDELRREELDDRPGYLTRVGFLAYNATLSLPDPIHRGVDINNRMLCEELNPPPGTIPPLPEPKPGQTNRERVTDHTSEGVCANCHMKIINPLGFAFEGFDAMGQVQTMDNGNVIDTADEYEFNDGIKPFEDAAGLIDLLIENKQTHACYTSRLAEYVLGRDVASGDEGLVTSTQEASSENAASIKELILAMVIDPKFTNAQGEAQ